MQAVRIASAGQPAALQPLIHPLGDTLAVFLPGPGSTHVLGGATRWVFEQVLHAPTAAIDPRVLYPAAHTQFDETAINEALYTLTQAGLLAQSPA